MDDDTRYERPCRWAMAVAGGIHWVAAALVLILSDHHAEDQFAAQLARAIQDLITAIVPALG